MKLSIPFKTNNTVFLQCIMIVLLYYLFLILAKGPDFYFLFLLPIIAVFIIVIIFTPEIVPYVLLSSNFFGIFLFEKSDITITITDIIFIIFCIGYFSSDVSEKLKSNYTNDKIYLFLILLFVSAIVSIFVNCIYYDLNHFVISLWYLFKFIQLPIVYFIFSHCKITNSQIERCIDICLLLSIMQIPVILYQYFTYQYGISFGIMRHRIHGTFTYHHSMLGTFMLISLALCVYRFLISRQKSHKIVYGFMMIMFMLILIVSGSRSAIFGLLFCLFCLFIYYFRFKAKHFLYCVFAVILIVVLYRFTPLGVMARSTFKLNSTYFLDASSFSRLLIWKGTIDHYVKGDIIQKIFGIGLCLFDTIVFDFTILTKKSASAAHNNALHILSELGILGLAIVVLLFYHILKELYTLSKENVLAKVYLFLTLALIGTSVTQETFWFSSAFGSLWCFYIIILSIALQKKGEVY